MKCDEAQIEAMLDDYDREAARTFFFRAADLAVHDQPQEDVLGRTLLVVHWRRRRIVALGTRGILFGAADG